MKFARFIPLTHDLWPSTGTKRSSAARMLLICLLAVCTSGEFSVALILTTSFCNYLSFADRLIPSCNLKQQSFWPSYLPLEKAKASTATTKYKLLFFPEASQRSGFPNP